MIPIKSNDKIPKKVITKRPIVQAINELGKEAIIKKENVSENIDKKNSEMPKNKSLEEMMKVETSKAKKEVVTKVLEELLSSENIKLTQDELANIVLKKVA